MARTINGIVSSAKADKTITVTVTSRETHPIYKKQYSVTRKYMAHDENNQAKEGDKVKIEESRPISKNKTWKLVEILERSNESLEVRDEVAETLEAKNEETK